MKGLIEQYKTSLQLRDRINKETDEVIAELERKRKTLLADVSRSMESIREQFDDQYGHLDGYQVYLPSTNTYLSRDNGVLAYFETEEAAQSVIGDRIPDASICRRWRITRGLWPSVTEAELDGFVRDYESLKRGAEGIVWPGVKKKRKKD